MENSLNHHRLLLHHLARQTRAGHVELDGGPQLRRVVNEYLAGSNGNGHSAGGIREKIKNWEDARAAVLDLEYMFEQVKTEMDEAFMSTYNHDQSTLPLVSVPLPFSSLSSYACLFCQA
jgi:hypothetical protein